MQHHINEEIVRRKLLAYISGRTSLKDFCAWLVPVAWDIDEWAPIKLRELVYGIKLPSRIHQWALVERGVTGIPYPLRYFDRH